MIDLDMSTNFFQTGTLTHDGLDLNYVLASNNAQFSAPISNIKTLDIEDMLVKGMATCHSLTRIDGVLNGDPLDLNMFAFTKWVSTKIEKNILNIYM